MVRLISMGSSRRFHLSAGRLRRRGGRVLYCCMPAVFILLFFTVCGCSAPPESEVVEEPEKQIGMLVSMSEQTPFFIRVVQGARDEAEAENAEITVRYAHDDARRQTAQFWELLKSGADLILLNPVSAELSPVIREARLAGVPVVVYDRGLEGVAAVSTVTSDNEGGGAMAGNHLAELLHKKGKVIELRGTPGSSAAMLRGRGFHRAMDAYPNMLEAGAAVGNFTRAGGRRACGRLVAEHPDLNGVFAHNDDMALGCLDVLRSFGMDKRVLVVGFDASDEAVDEVERGGMAATIAQRPSEIGRLSVEIGLRALRNESVPQTVYIDLALIIR